MKHIYVGASVKEYDKIEQYHSLFDNLEIDLNVVKGDFLKIIKRFGDKVYSVHLRHDNLTAAVNSMKYVKLCQGKVAVFHPEYPEDFEQLMRDLKIISKISRKKGIPVMIENLCDRKRKSGEYGGARSPITICEALEQLGNHRLGLCLDTGHAVSNELTKWCNPLVYKWLKHIHLSDNVVGRDLHLPFTPITNWRLKVGVRRILRKTHNDVIVILENKTLKDTIKSYKYFARKISSKAKKLVA